MIRNFDTRDFFALSRATFSKIGIFFPFLLLYGFSETTSIQSASADLRELFTKRGVVVTEEEFSRDFFENVLEELKKREKKTFGTTMHVTIGNLLNDLQNTINKNFFSVEEYFTNEEKKEVANALGEICVNAINKVHSISFSKKDLKNIQDKIDRFQKASENFPPIKRYNYIQKLIDDVQLENQTNALTNSPAASKSPNESITKNKEDLLSILEEFVEKVGYETPEFRFYREKMIKAGIADLIYENKAFLKAAQTALKNKKKAYQNQIESLKNEKAFKTPGSDQHFYHYEKLIAFETRLKTISDALDEVKSTRKVLKSNLNLEASSDRQKPTKNLTKSLPQSVMSNSYKVSNERINKQQCDLIRFDNRAHMGGDANQRNTGTCWAHATAALFEEQLCLARAEYCGKRIARTQIVGLVDGDIFTREGRSTESVLKYFTDEKEGNFQVCLDPYRRNPFDVREGPFQWSSFLNNQEKEKNLRFNYVKYLKSEYRRIKSTEISSPFCKFQSKREAFDSLSKDWQRLITFLDNSIEIKDKASDSKNTKNKKSGLEGFAFFKSSKNLSHGKELQFDNVLPASSTASNSSVLNNYLSPAEFEALAKSSSNETDFVRKVLVAPCNQPNRKASFKREQNQSVITRIPSSHSTSEKLETFLDAFSNAKQYNHSLILALCANRIIDSKETSIDTFYNRTCGSHAVVASAVAWNDQKKSCQVYIKNSWGQGSLLSSGWYPMETILKNTREVNYFGSLSP